MNYPSGAYPRNQRLALLVLVLTGFAGFWLANRIVFPGTPPTKVLAAAASLRNGLAAAERKEFRPPPEAFAFDPNTVTGEELVRLGLSEKQAAGWLKFRGTRSNAFRKPEDIGKLYVLGADDKARLIPLAYIVPAVKGARPQVQSFVFDPNTVSEPDLRRLGLSKKQATGFVHYRSKSKYGRAFRQADDIRRLNTLSDQQKDHLVALAEIPPEEKTAPAPRQRFRFDPNIISADSLELLGFPGWQAKSLLRYRGDRPRTFRRATDLRRVKSLDSALVEEILALVEIAPLPPTAPAAAHERSSMRDPDEAKTDLGTAPSTYAYAPKVPLPAPASFDINTADTTSWKSLPGIGSYRARRIVRFRQALGGFASVAQVGDTRGLPDSTFAAIRPYLKSSPVFRPLRVNQATYEELNRHPYINRNLANSIVRNREKFGRFAGPEDLRRLRLITEQNLPTLLPYFSFE